MLAHEKAFSKAELAQLRKDFLRFSTPLPGDDRHYPDDWVETRILTEADLLFMLREQTDAFGAAEGEFFTQKIFEKFAVTNEHGTKGLTYPLYVDACYLFLKASRDEKIEWLYSIVEVPTAPISKDSMEVSKEVLDEPDEVSLVEFIEYFFSAAAPVANKAALSPRKRFPSVQEDPVVNNFVLQQSSSTTETPSNSDVVGEAEADQASSSKAAIVVSDDAKGHSRRMSESLTAVADMYKQMDATPGAPLPAHLEAESAVQKVQRSNAKGVAPVLTFPVFRMRLHKALNYWRQYGDYFTRIFEPTVEVSDKYEDGDAHVEGPSRGTHFLLMLANPTKSMKTLRRLFLSFSGNQDRISTPELTRLLTELGCASGYVSHLIVQAYSNKIHPDSIAFQDLVEIGSLFINGTPKQRYEWLFSIVDSDNDGYVSRQEALVMLVELSAAARQAKHLHEKGVFNDEEMSSLRDADQHARVVLTACFDEHLMELGKPLDVDYSDLRTVTQLLTALERWEFRADFLKGMVSVIGFEPNAVSERTISDWSTAGGLSQVLVEKRAMLRHEDELKKPAETQSSSPTPTVVSSSQEEKQKARRERWQKFILFFLMLNSEMALFFITVMGSVFSTAIIDEFQVGKSFVGIFGSMQTIGYVVAIFWTKYMMATIGMWWAGMFNGTMILGGCVAMFIAARTKDFALFLIAPLLWGLGDQYLMVSIMVVRHFPKNAGAMFGIMTSYYIVTLVSASFLLPYLVSTNFVLALDICSIVCVFSGLVTFTLVVYERRLRHSVEGPQEEQPSGLQQLLQRMRELVPRLRINNVSQLGEVYRALFAMNTSFWLLNIHAALSFSVHYQLLFYYPLYIHEEKGYSSFVASLFIPGVVNIVASVVTPIMGYVFDKYGNRTKTAATTCALQLLIVILVTVSYSEAYPAVLAFVLGCNQAVFRVMGIPALSVLLPWYRVPVATTLYMLTFSITIVVYSYVCGFVYETVNFHTFSVIILISNGVALLCMLALMHRDRAVHRSQLEAAPTTVNLKHLPAVRYKRLDSTSTQIASGAPEVELDSKSVSMLPLTRLRKRSEVRSAVSRLTDDS